MIVAYMYHKLTNYFFSFSENPEEFVSLIKRETTHEEAASSVTSKKDSISSKHQASTVTSATDNDFVKSMKNTVSEASSKISSLLNVNTSPPIKNSYTNSLSPKAEISSSSSCLSTRTHSPLSATSNHLSTSSPQEIRQLSKQSMQRLDNNVENHSLESSGVEDLSVSADSSVDLPMDVESEKEDVTATLALLNSMASELNEVLDVEGTL